MIYIVEFYTDKVLVKTDTYVGDRQVRRAQAAWLARDSRNATCVRLDRALDNFVSGDANGFDQYGG